MKGAKYLLNIFLIFSYILRKLTNLKLPILFWILNIFEKNVKIYKENKSLK